MADNVPSSGASSSPPTAKASSDILAGIIDKERQLEAAIHHAHEEATRLLQAARDQAADLVERQKTEAQTSSAQVKEEILRKAREEATRVLASSGREIEDLKDIPRERIDAATDRLLSLLLPPRAAKEGDR